MFVKWIGFYTITFFLKIIFSPKYKTSNFHQPETIHQSSSSKYNLCSVEKVQYSKENDLITIHFLYMSNHI